MDGRAAPEEAEMAKQTTAKRWTVTADDATALRELAKLAGDPGAHVLRAEVRVALARRLEDVAHCAALAEIAEDGPEPGQALDHLAAAADALAALVGAIRRVELAPVAARA